MTRAHRSPKGESNISCATTLSPDDAAHQSLKGAKKHTRESKAGGSSLRLNSNSHHLNNSPHLQDNLIIQGDNLQALKSLLPYYEGRVKCIYIDPPYNTGKEGWVYNDNLKSPLVKSWLGQAVGMDDMQRHDKWCCMMWPRLQLLKDLLSDDGSIFVSIDSNEHHYLRCMMDEIFGEENFVSDIAWWSKYTLSNDASRVSSQHQNILFYAKSIDNFKIGLLPRTEAMDAAYKNPDKDPRGPWKATPLHAKGGSKKSHYDFKFSNGRVWRCPVGRHPRFAKEKLISLDTQGRIYFGKDGNGEPQNKTYLSEVKPGKTVGSLWEYKEVGSTHEHNDELSRILGKGIFETPKGTGLIKKIIQIANVQKTDVVLDSFAGSGTTAQAVLELNKHDGGNRKFILVECEEYAKKITAERVRRVIRGVPKAKSEVLRQGLGGSFTYCTLDKAFDEEKFLTGEWKPTRAALSRYIFHTATGEVLKKFEPSPDFYVGRKKNTGLFVVYKPGLDFLRSSKAALTLENQELMLKRMKHDKLKKAYVFAMACFVPPEDLHNIHFCQIPFAIHEAIGRHAT